jgi:hypothetical protein
LPSASLIDLSSPIGSQHRICSAANRITTFERFSTLHAAVSESICHARCDGAFSISARKVTFTIEWGSRRLVDEVNKKKRLFEATSGGIVEICRTINASTFVSNPKTVSSAAHQHER